MVAYVKNKYSLSLFRRHLEGFIEGTIRGDDFQAGGKHDKPKLFHLKERFLLCLEVCFGFSFYNSAAPLIALRSLILALQFH